MSLGHYWGSNDPVEKYRIHLMATIFRPVTHLSGELIYSNITTAFYVGFPLATVGSVYISTLTQLPDQV